MAINVVPTDAMQHVTTGAHCPCEPRDQLIQREGEPDLWLVLHKYVPRTPAKRAVRCWEFGGCPNDATGIRTTATATWPACDVHRDALDDSPNRT